MVLKNVHDRTHQNNGSLIIKKPSVLELLTHFPAESQVCVVSRQSLIRGKLLSAHGRTCSVWNHTLRLPRAPEK